MQKTFQPMREYYEKHKWMLALTVLLTVICFGGHAISTNIGIDTEQYILGDYGKSWIIQSLGRFGYYYSVMAMNGGHYSPYMNGIMFLVFFCSAALLWPYVFYKISGRDDRYSSYILFPCIFLTNPIWAAQFYFTLQQGAVAFGIFLQAVSFLLLFDVLLNENPRKKSRDFVQIVVSVLCAFYAIGTYQTFPGLHLVEAAACLLILFDRLADRDPTLESHKLFWKSTLVVILHFFASYFLYLFVCKVMNWGTSNYLQMKWGQKPAREIVADLWNDFRNILFGREVYAGWILLLSLILMVFLVLQMFQRHRNVWLKIDYVLLAIGNIVAIIALNIVIGGVPADRARLPVIFSVAFLGMYTLSRCGVLMKTQGRTLIYTAAGMVIVLSLCMQTHRLQTLFYTDDICNMQEFEVGADIVRNIEAVGGDDYSTVVVVGKWDAPLNASCLKQAPIGVSSFNWDYIEDQPTSGTRRSVLYLNAAFGKMYNAAPDENQRNLAVSLAEEMPAYPGAGYVHNKEGIIIVKLS